MTLAACNCDLYVRADAATFKAIAPEYEKLVNESEDFSDEQKAIRRQTLDTWAKRLQSAGAEVKR